MKSLVFVHGYLGGSQQWADQVGTFSPCFNVIALDLPGFGLNRDIESPDSIHEYARYALAALSAMGIETFHLVGHSMGGMIVQEMISLAPQRVEKLVLYGTGPIGMLPGRFETLEESRRRVTTEGVETTGRRIAATWFLHGEKGQGYEVCAKLAVQPSLQAAKAALTAMETWSGVSFLPNIQSETLILWGDNDRAYQWEQVEQLWRSIESVQLSVIPACSHAVHLEKPNIFNTILGDFLAAN